VSRQRTSKRSINSLMAALSPVRYFGFVMVATQLKKAIPMCGGKSLSLLSTLTVNSPLNFE
jgi:hypothetical protein